MHAGNNVRGAAAITPSKMASAASTINEAELMAFLAQGGLEPVFARAKQLGWPIRLNLPNTAQPDDHRELGSRDIDGRIRAG